MANITKQDLDHLAGLARIRLSETEEERLTGDLEKILNYFQELQALDTSNVEPMAGGTTLRNVFREDTASESTNQGKGTDQFPETKDGYDKVPPVFE